MEIKNIVIYPYRDALEPAFLISMDCYYSNPIEVLLKFKGTLNIHNQMLSLLHESPLKNRRSDPLSAISNQEQEYWRVAQFIVPLSKGILHRLEEHRLSDSKGNLHLQLNFEITSLDSSFIEVPSQKVKGGYVPVMKNNSLLRMKSHDFRKDVEINRGTWINDFCPVLENKKYMVFEMPLPSLRKGEGDIYQRLHEAIGALDNLEKARLNGDWNGVIKESRPIWELANHRQQIENLLQKESLDQTTIDEYKNIINLLFQFSSKFVHRVNKTASIMSPNNASKEDAEFIYAIAFSLINLLARKLARNTP